METAEFGVRLPVAGPLATPDAIRYSAVLAEQLGYDAVWVHDFIVWTRELDRTHVSCGSIEAVEQAGPDAPPVFYDSLVNLAFLAGYTRRIRIGVAVLSIPYRHPLITARQLAAIDALSGGRLIIGAGVGGPKTTHNVDFEVLGIRRTEKYPMTLDYLRSMVHVWTRDGGYEGDFVSFPPVEIYPKPVQRPYPPLWVSGKGDKSLDIAAELATGWFSPWLPPEQYPALIAGLAERARDKGRRDVDFRIASEVYVCIDETTEEAIGNAAATLAVLNQSLMTEGLSRDKTRLVGTPDEIAEKLRAYTEAGVQHYEMKFIYRSIDHLEHQLRLFASNVLPHFRQRQPA